MIIKYFDKNIKFVCYKQFESLRKVMKCSGTDAGKKIIKLMFYIEKMSNVQD